jgi:hypothetical protein
MRKKIIYLISWNYNPYNGVVNKIFDQLNIWNTNSDVILVWLEGTNNKIDIKHKTNFKSYIFNIKYNLFNYHKIISLVNDINPDYIYIRYPFFHPLLYFICKKYKTIFEINTLENKEMLINLKKIKSLKFIYATSFFFV